MQIYFQKTLPGLSPPPPLRKMLEKLCPKHKSIYVPSWCVCLEIAFVHGWLALHFVFGDWQCPVGQLLEDSPPVLSRGPPLLISCSRSLLDLPINGQNSGMSLGASWRRVMLGRRVTDGAEWAKTYWGRGGARDRQRGHVLTPVFVRDRTILSSF